MRAHSHILNKNPGRAVRQRAGAKEQCNNADHIAVRGSRQL
jgi:hypothetical protein